MADEAEQQCIFCKIISGEVPSKKVYEDNIVSAILDINPANLGHVLLLPKQHYQIMPQVPENELSHMFKIAKYISNAVLKAMLGNSTTIFVANGAAAGQKAPHFMIHIIPRKKDDGLFDIPKRKSVESELIKVQTMIIGRLKERLGRDPVSTSEVKKEETKPEEKKIPKPEPAEAEEANPVPEKKEKEPKKEPAKKRKVPKKPKDKPKKDDEEVDLDKLTDLLTK